MSQGLTRGMLRSPNAVVSGGSSSQDATVADGFVVRVLHGAMSAVAVVGRPPSAAIARAVEGTTEMTPVIAQVENADYVARSLNASTPPPHSTAWHSESVILHTIKSDPVLPPLDPSATVRMISPDDRLEHLPPAFDMK